MKLTIKQLKQLIKEQVEEVANDNDDLLALINKHRDSAYEANREEAREQQSEAGMKSSLEDMLNNLLKAAESGVLDMTGDGSKKELAARKRMVEKIKEDIIAIFGGK